MMSLVLSLGVGCDMVGMVGEGIVGDAPAIEQGDGDHQGITLSEGDDVQPTGCGDPADPAPPPPEPDATPPGDPAIAYEGEGCWKRTCYQGLACVLVYNGDAVVGKFCMERCGTLGNDPNCDGGEACTESQAEGRVCFDPNSPDAGFTSNSPGSAGGQGAPPPPPPPDNGGAAPPPPGSGGSCGGPEESQVFDMLNQVRAQYGRGPLQCDPAGANVARQHSQDMCNRGYFSHTSPDGKTPWARLQAGGVPFSSAGENIAMGYQSAQSVHNGWMNSPGHQQNMLSGSWTRVGIGLIHCGGTPYWTEVFMR
jgi:uncharacterized protein YkwD